MQISEHAAEQASSSTGNGGDQSARIVNMLRGGILYVKIRKGMDMTGDDEDGLPSSARQVSMPARFVPVQACNLHIDTLA